MPKIKEKKEKKPGEVESGPPDSLVADGLVSVDEAMTFLSVSRSTVYELMDKGHLPRAISKLTYATEEKE